MKIIFLDIDGVLNTPTTENPKHFPYIVEPELVARLKRLLDLTGAQIVLSSTWRYDPVGRLAAAHYGIDFIDYLRDLPRTTRGEEISQWLEDHPDVERFLVIDDEDDRLDKLPLFQPMAKRGLDDDIVEAAAAYLNGDTDQDARRPALSRFFQNVASTAREHRG